MLAPTVVGAEAQSQRSIPSVRSRGRARFVEQGDLLLSVEGAKLFRKGTYPLHSSLQPIVATELSNFAARPAEAQDDATRIVLRAALGRMIAMGFPTVTGN